jgi:mannonate dehydratase
MYMTFRWFGADDPVTLEWIRQIPSVEGIVAALYHLPPGVEWPKEELERLRDTIEEAGLRFSVVESVPVHESIKLGAPERDELIDCYCRSIENIGAVGVGVICYNFMPVFDWFRTSLDMRLEDGSTALGFDGETLTALDLGRKDVTLPGWFPPAGGLTFADLVSRYDKVDDERLWENLSYFLEQVVPVAEAAGVRMAIHPDDPPWPIFGLPRIIRDAAALDRFLGLIDSPANGVTFCTGSLGASPANDLPAMIHRIGNRVHFAHCRNVQVTGEHRFHETAHPSAKGSVDMLAVMKAFRDIGFAGPMRPDHGRMIWGESGRPGYGLHDRALGAMYLQGLWEGVNAAT